MVHPKEHLRSRAGCPEAALLPIKVAVKAAIKATTLDHADPDPLWIMTFKTLSE
jgi:hypothetical protein